MEAPAEVSAGGDAAWRVEELERELAQARQALEDFTHSVSHDLRAPLRHVQAYLRIAREDLGEALDPAVAAHLDTAAGAAVQLGRMIDGLLELARLGRTDLQCDPVDLGRLLGDLRRQMDERAQARVLDWHIAPDLPPVQGDAALLGRMLGCLLDNALKFTRDCAGAARIEVGWRALAGGRCEIHVQDNGAGFDPRTQERLFRVFQRLHGARQFEGLGLGLALARKVVERHGGQIRASGAPGQGCRIAFDLPLA